MLKEIIKMFIAVLVLCGFAIYSTAQEKKSDDKKAATICPVAIFTFSVREKGVKDQGKQVADLLFAKMIEDPDLWLVERDEMAKILSEAELNLSGVVNPDQAIQIGKLTGAKIIITGSVFKVRNKTYIVAKVIGTETSRVLGKSVKGTEDIDLLVDKLGAEVSKIIKEDSAKLIAKVRTKKDLIASLEKKIGKSVKPKVYVKISEEHLGERVPDPAAETEMQSICKELGFVVTENEAAADVVIKGEGFSQFSTRRGNLISVKARLEVKAVDRDGNVLAVDRQTDVQVGLAEQVTAKQALQEASAKIAERLLPKICKKDSASEK